jgi:hypothetical protein
MLVSLIGEWAFFANNIEPHLDSRGVLRVVSLVPALWRDKTQYAEALKRVLVVRVRESLVEFGRSTVRDTPRIGTIDRRISLENIDVLNRTMAQGVSGLSRVCSAYCADLKLELRVIHMKTNDDAGLKLEMPVEPINGNEPGMWGPAELGPVTHMIRRTVVKLEIVNGELKMSFSTIEPQVRRYGILMSENRFEPCFGDLPRPAGEGPREEVAFIE